jgi:hypothetical protein
MTEHGMNVNSEIVYLKTLTAHKLPHGISVVSLSQLASAFSQMAKDLRSQEAAAAQQEAFQGAIAYAAESARHLTPSERAAVQNVLHTAFDGLPRRHSAMAVRADFLRQVRFPPGTGSVGPLYPSAVR